MHDPVPEPLESAAPVGSACVGAEEVCCEPALDDDESVGFPP